MTEFVLKWGICSAGRIANDFVLCLNMMEQTRHKVTAVSARDLERAKSFAKKHSISKAYGSYKGLANDKNVDVVYIASIHPYHFSLSKLMLESGKHVLCEKPLCVNVKETKRLIEIARSKNLFLMEGLWSRFFPAYKKVRELIDSGVIGEVQHVQAHFGGYEAMLEPLLKEKENSGGILLSWGLLV